MDRLLSRGERFGTKIKWVAGAVLVVVLFGIAAFLVRGWLRPSLSRDKVMIARVEQGTVSAAIETTGVLAAHRETVLTAPAETRILKVLRQPGSAVKTGEPILTLDVSDLELERETLRQQLAVKRNAKEQARLRFEKQEKALVGQRQLMDLDLRYLDTRFRQQKLLYEKRLVSLEALQQAELELEKKKVERGQLDDKEADERATHQAEQDGLDLEIALLDKSIDQVVGRLARATTKAPADGVLTWVVEAEGSTVRSGEPLARIADLSRYKVSATISDFYAGRLAEGQPCLIRIGDTELEGHLSRMLPEVTNGTLAFEIAFENRGGVSLRPNQRVDVYLSTANRDRVLRLRRGPGVAGSGRQQVYVVRGGNVVRTNIEIGVTGRQYVEIVSGLAPGDEVVLSDLTRLAHLQTIPIQ